MPRVTLGRMVPWLFAVLLLGLTAGPALVGHTFYAADVLTFRVPYLAAFGALLRRGEWPSWSTLPGGGMALWHHPSASLADPTALLTALFPSETAYALGWALHVQWAFWALWWCGLRLRASSTWSACAAFLAVVGGPLGAHWMVTFLEPSAVVAMVVAGVAAARLRHQAALWVVALAFCFRTLRPDPPTVLGSVLLSLCITWALRGSLRTWFSGALCGGLLGALFWVPAWGVVRDSWREGALTPTVGMLGWGHVAASLFPGITGVSGATGPGVGVQAAMPFHGGVVNTLFIGLSTVLVLLLRSRRKMRSVDAVLLAVAGACALVVCLSTLEVMAPAWRNLGVRYPDKLWLVSATAVLLFSARRASRVACSAPAGAAAVVVGTVLVVGHPWWGTWFTSAYEVREAAAVHVASHALLRSGVVLTLLGVALLWMPTRRTWARGAWVSAVALEGVAAFASQHPHAPMEALGAHRPGPVSRMYAGDPRQVVAANMGLTSPELPDHATVQLQTRLLLPLHGVRDGVGYVLNGDFSGFEPARARRLVQLHLPHLEPGAATTLLANLGAEFLVVPARQAWPPWLKKVTGISVGPMGSWDVLVPVTPQAPVSVETQWVSAGDEAAAAGALSLESPRVVVEGAPPPGPRVHATLEVLELGEQRIAVRVDVTGGPALVVARRAWGSGWNARVDGETRTVVPTNVMQAGVLVGPGSHVVTMDHAPPGLGVGGALAALGLLLLTWQVKRAGVRT